MSLPRGAVAWSVIVTFFYASNVPKKSSHSINWAATR